MSMVPSADRRQHTRQPLAGAVVMYHQPSQRQYVARAVDISQGGMMVYMPAAAPVGAGHEVQMTITGSLRPEFEEMRNKALAAQVVRVNRRPLTTAGHVAVGVRFEPEAS